MLRAAVTDAQGLSVKSKSTTPQGHFYYIRTGAPLPFYLCMLYVCQVEKIRRFAAKYHIPLISSCGSQNADLPLLLRMG